MARLKARHVRQEHKGKHGVNSADSDDFMVAFCPEDDFPKGSRFTAPEMAQDLRNGNWPDGAILVFKRKDIKLKLKVKNRHLYLEDGTLFYFRKYIRSRFPEIEA